MSHFVTPQGHSDEEIAAELAPGPDDPAPLTQEEEEERAVLLREGFSGWNRRDFQVGVCGVAWFRNVGRRVHE